LKVLAPSEEVDSFDIGLAGGGGLSWNHTVDFGGKVNTNPMAFSGTLFDGDAPFAGHRPYCLTNLVAAEAGALRHTVDREDSILGAQEPRVAEKVLVNGSLVGIKVELWYQEVLHLRVYGLPFFHMFPTPNGELR
jgi:hypothetical protein